MPSFQKNATIQEIVLHKSASTIIPTLCLTFSGTRILHRQLERIYTDIIFSFIPYNTCYFHYRQIFFTILEVSDMVTDKVSDIYCRYPASHKAITYWFSIIFLSDMLPTCLRHLSPTFTSALPPHYRHHYRQKEIYTDIYTDKTAATFSVHRPTAKLIIFPKLSQKREEGEKRKKQVYTLSYKDSTSTVQNIQSRC